VAETRARTSSLTPRRVRVHYPLREGERILLRSEADWERDLAPTRLAAAAGRSEFRLEFPGAHTQFKPVLQRAGETLWAQGENLVALAGGRDTLEVWPYFDRDESCHVCDLHTPPVGATRRGHQVRVWLPPGYGENTLQRFPVVYMQDGHNLFFPQESFAGETWRMQETLRVLQDMSLTRQVVVVGILPRDRQTEYTAPGYDDYARFLVEDLKPWVDEHYRTLCGPGDTLVMGSSLGGVVSLHLGWSHPEVFGRVACLSSTFGYADDLFERVRRGPRPPLSIYLDSGWPHDNFEATRSMRSELLRLGFREGHDLHYLAFPRATHDERHWALRAHIPLQLSFGQRG
jgi:predicted alpha/beta superfamily hydrolase